MFWGECSCGAVGCAEEGGFFQGQFDRSVKWYGDFDVEASANEGQAEFFFLFLGSLYTQAAIDRLSGFVYDIGVIGVLSEVFSGCGEAV